MRLNQTYKKNKDGSMTLIEEVELPDYIEPEPPKTLNELIELLKKKGVI